MCRHVSVSIQDDVESCEDLLKSLRQKRISLQSGVLDKLMNSPIINMPPMKDSQRSGKRESYDIAKQRLHLKFD